MHNVEAAIEELFGTLRATWKEALERSDLDSSLLEDVVKRVQDIDTAFAAFLQDLTRGAAKPDELQVLLDRARIELRRVRRATEGERAPTAPFAWYGREQPFA
ncbi:hypothetical protein [Deinococcus yavapaiensis]|uniref:Uncharacterized protein n=1 Tax=Deinococcus yavapaiensis KR-236 TaxID=694435 RepID=A0A318S9J5_9DEIO|nr:hypothetical protein [Deinococcus yavapaiensis]PYE53133.1 hypothetical protein DES52_110117 [Deinococcus yavapaiensis KR-236]